MLLGPNLQSVRVKLLDRARKLVAAHHLLLAGFFRSLLYRQVDQFAHLCSRMSHPIHRSGWQESSRDPRAGQRSYGHAASDGREHYILGDGHRHHAGPRPSSLFCCTGYVPASLPTRGSSVPAPSSRLQMKPLRNAHWCPLKHQLSPLYYSPSPPKPKGNSTEDAGWVGALQ